MLSFILPTRNRHEELAETLARLGALDPAALDRAGGAEVIIIDNRSDDPVAVQRVLPNGVCVSLVELDDNLGASARNIGAVHARGDWLVMLDDDSSPLDTRFIEELKGAPADVAAVGAEILLPNGRESGGLPEVFVGCGAAIRRDAYLECRGYDEAFGYYVEEYDLCAKLIADGWRITHSRRFRVLHRKSQRSRDTDRILHHLVRNNGWTIARYSPEHELDLALDAMLARYRAIAMKEHAVKGYEAGLDELSQTINDQRHTPLTLSQYDRFTGKAAASTHLGWALDEFDRPGIVSAGKHAEYIRAALKERGCPAVPIHRANLAVVGTLSPGPMLSAAKQYTGPLPMLTPWVVPGRIAGLERDALTNTHPIRLRAAG